jgi:hypothetical protein
MTKTGLLFGAVLALSVTWLSACARQQVWVRNGSTQDDFYRDRGQCQAQGFSVANPSLLQAAIVFNSCMQGKGWYLQDQ